MYKRGIGTGSASEMQYVGKCGAACYNGNYSHNKDHNNFTRFTSWQQAVQVWRLGDSEKRLPPQKVELNLQRPGHTGTIWCCQLTLTVHVQKKFPLESDMVCPASSLRYLKCNEGLPGPPILDTNYMNRHRDALKWRYDATRHDKFL